eukprot:COSAG02_NODE_1384_length_12956_cov_126.308446_6_plen_62_part_00
MINYEIVMEVTCSFDAGTPVDPNHNKLVSNYNEINTHLIRLSARGRGTCKAGPSSINVHRS